MTTLHLSTNSISSVEPHVFDESSNLTSLTDVYLSYNRLTELEPWPLVRAERRSMSVDLSGNRIARFTNAMRWSFDCNRTRVLKTELDLSANYVKHVSDIFIGWNVDGKRLRYQVAYMRPNKNKRA